MITVFRLCEGMVSTGPGSGWQGRVWCAAQSWCCCSALWLCWDPLSKSRKPHSNSLGSWAVFQGSKYFLFLLYFDKGIKMAGATIIPFAPLQACALWSMWGWASAAPLAAAAGCWKLSHRKCHVFDFWAVALLRAGARLRKALFLPGFEEHLLSSQHGRKQISKEISNPEGSRENGRTLGLRATASALPSPWRETKVSTDSKGKRLGAWCLLLERPRKQKPRPGASSLTRGVNVCAQLERSQSKGDLTVTGTPLQFWARATTVPQPCKCSTGWSMDNLPSFLSVSTPGSATGLVPQLPLSTLRFSSPTNPIYLFKIFCYESLWTYTKIKRIV